MAEPRDSEIVTEIHNADDFNKVIKQKGITVLDFFSPVCAPCKVVLPLYKDLAEKYPNAKFYKVNGYSEPGTSMQKSINVVWWPTFVVLVDGKEKFREKIPNPPQQFPTKKLGDIIAAL